MSAINVTDAAGQTFSVEGCATIGDLKLSILEHTGIPVDRQQLARRDTPAVEMVDATRLDGKDELALMVKDTNGGCEVAPFFLKIQSPHTHATHRLAAAPNQPGCALHRMDRIGPDRMLVAAGTSAGARRFSPRLMSFAFFFFFLSLLLFVCALELADFECKFR